MLTSVYLSNEQVLVVNGKATKNKIKVKSFLTRALPEGTMINGVITNEAAAKAVLTQLRRERRLPKKDVRLVIDSGSVLLKLEKVPALGPKKLLEYTKNAFSEVAESHENLLYDYSVVVPRNKGTRGGTVLCSAVESQFIESYIELFSAAGIQLYSINIALNCVVKLAHYLNELAKKTYILCTIDGNIVISSLFLEGQYSFSNRSRLFSERGTEESATEIGRTISSLVQFNKSQKSGSEVTSVYLCGLYQGESALCHTITAELGIETSPLPHCAAVTYRKQKGKPGFELSSYLFATGNLLKG